MASDHEFKTSMWTWTRLWVIIEMRNYAKNLQRGKTLVDSELVRGRQHVLNFASNRIDSSFLMDKLQYVYENLQCANINMALGFVLRNVEDGKCRYFYAHENNLLLERSQLIANKEHLLELQKSVDDVNIVELSARERSSTKWKFLFATNVTFFAALLKSIPVGCKDILLPPHLVKRADVNCFTFKSNKERYNDNLCLLRAVCMHKTGTERLEEETSKHLSALLDINSNLSVENFRGVVLEGRRYSRRWRSSKAEHLVVWYWSIRKRNCRWTSSMIFA